MPSGSKWCFDAKVEGSIPTAPRSSYNGSCFDHGIEGNLVKLLEAFPAAVRCEDHFDRDAVMKDRTASWQGSEDVGVSPLSGLSRMAILSGGYNA